MSAVMVEERTVTSSPEPGDFTVRQVADAAAALGLTLGELMDLSASIRAEAPVAA